MNKLIYVIYDYYSKEKLFFLETDGKKNIISENEINNFPRVQKNFFLISDLFNFPDTLIAMAFSISIGSSLSIIIEIIGSKTWLFKAKRF